MRYDISISKQLLGKIKKAINVTITDKQINIIKERGVMMI